MRALHEAIGRLIGAPKSTRSLSLVAARQVMPFADGIAANKRVNSVYLSNGRCQLNRSCSKLSTIILESAEFAQFTWQISDEQLLANLKIVGGSGEQSVGVVSGGSGLEGCVAEIE
jgi:hypothetical protein